MAVGLPLVCTPIPDQLSIVEDSGTGICKDFTSSDLAEGINFY